MSNDFPRYGNQLTVRGAFLAMLEGFCDNDSLVATALRLDIQKTMMAAGRATMRVILWAKGDALGWASWPDVVPEGAEIGDEYVATLTLKLRPP